MKKSLCALLGLVLTASLTVEAQKSSTLPAANPGFTENRGQILDDKGNPRPDILYTASVNGVQIFFRKDALSYVFSQNQSQNGKELTAALRTDIVFQNALPSVRTDAAELLPGIGNYYLGHGNFTGVRSFKKLKYENIYPNVDLVFYFNHSGALKYDFIVHPGGNPDQIRMQYNGFRSASVNRDGSLNATHAFGQYAEDKPVTYSGTQIVDSRFEFQNGVLSFNISDYDKNQDLVIDPLTRIWAGNAGGNLLDRALAVSVGADGAVTYVGISASANFPTTPGTVQTTFGGGNDALIARYNADNTLAWATYYGGSGVDQGLGIASDAAGNTVAVGWAQSPNFPTTLNALPNHNGTTADGFILKLNPDGTRSWATLFGGTSSDQLYGAAISADGSVNVIGRTFSAGLATLGANTTVANSRDVVIMKLDAAGTRTWSTYYGGANDDQGIGIALDAADNIYIAGHTKSTNLPTGGTPFQAANAGGDDLFAAQYSPAGTRNWATYYGSTAADFTNGVFFNRANSTFYIVGQTAGSGFPTTGGAVYGGGSNDGFLIGFSSTGSRSFARLLGGTADDKLYGVTAIGNKLYVAGVTLSPSISPNDPGAVDLPFQSSNAGALDTYIMKIDASASNANTNDWSFMYGAPSDDVARAIASNTNGRIAVAGYTNSPAFPVFRSPNPGQAAPATGNDDAYVLVLTDEVGVLPCTPFTTTATRTNPSCAAATDGTITVTQPEARATVLFTLLDESGNPVTGRNPQAAATFTGVAAGTYTVRATDSNGNCTDDSDNLVLTAGPDLTVTLTSVNPGCLGQTNGTVAVVSPVGTDFEYTITGGSTTPTTLTTFSGLGAGSYVVTARNRRNNCTGASAPATLTAPTALTPSVTNTTLPCGQTTGTLTVNVTGGTLPIAKYEIIGNGARDNATNNAFNNLAVGQYNFQVTDSRGCTATTTGAVLNNAIEVGSLGSPTTCGLSNGSINVTFTNGGTPPYQYRVRLEAGGFERPYQGATLFENLPAGIYIVEVRDVNGCIGSTINSDVKDNPNTLQITDLLFNTTNCRTGLTNLTVVASTTRNPISYRLSGPNGTLTQTNNLFTGLVPGNYILELSDNDGCRIPARPFTVEQPLPFRLNQIALIQPNCADGQLRGIITAAPVNLGSLSLQYVLTDNSDNVLQGPLAPQGLIFENDITIGELTPGSYKLIGRTNTGCNDTLLFTVRDANGISVSNAAFQSPTCGGRSDAQISVDILGGTAPIRYVLTSGTQTIATLNKADANDPDLRSANFTGLPSGTYKVAVSDVNSCAAETTLVVGEPTPLKINSFTLTRPTACGAQDGRIQINVTGGSGSYLFSLNGVDAGGNPLIENVPAGYYRVRIEDAADVPDGVERCRVDSFFVLNDPGAPEILNVQAINTSCANDPERSNTGQIVVSVSSPIRPLYFYSAGFNSTPVIVNGTTHTFRNLGAGDYEIVVATDLFPNGCAAYFPPVKITAPEPLIVTGVNILSQPTCGPGNTGGTLQVTAKGGSGNYSYSIDNGLTFQSSNIFTNVYPNAGGYTAVVRDLNGGCLSTGGTYFLANPSGLEITEPPILTPPTCGQSNGSIRVIARGPSGNRFYSLNGGPETASSAGSFTFSNLGTGVYTVRVRDAQGCKANAIVNFSEIALGNQTVTQPTCGESNGAVSMRLTGGSNNYKFRVTGFAFDAANLGAGPSEFGPVTGLAVGTISLTGLAPGTYEVEIEDSLGSCKLNIPVNLSSRGGPGIVNVVTQNRTCNIGNGNGQGGAISIFATGNADRYYISSANGVNLNVANNSGNATFNAALNGGQNLPAGTYYTFASRNNCLTAGGAFTITQPDLIIINDVAVTQPSCSGGSSTLGSIRVAASGGRNLQYSIGGTNWQSGNTFNNLSPDPAGLNLFVREAGETNCQVQWPFGVQITNPSGMSIATVAAQTTNPPCNDLNGGVITVRVTGGVGPYRMFIGGTEDGRLNAAGTYSYRRLSAGNYLIAVVDANNCADRVNVTLTNPAGITFVNAGITVTQPGACIGGAINFDFSSVNPPGNYEYALYDGAFQQLGTSFNNLTSGVYEVTVRDVTTGCTKDTLIYLNSTTTALLSMDGIAADDITCFGAADGRITVFASRPAAGANAPVQVSINGITPNTSNPGTVITTNGQAVFNNLPPGLYEVIISNGDEPVFPGYCVSALGSYRIRIDQPQRLIINRVTTTDQNCASGTLGQIEITAFGGSGEFQYSINNGVNWQNSNIFTGLQPSNLNANPGLGIPETYTVAVRDKRNPQCSTTFAGTVRIFNQSRLFLIVNSGVGGDIQNVTCPGQSNGSLRFNPEVNANVVPSPFPLRYFLNGRQVYTAANNVVLTFTARNLAAGNYEMKVIDNNGCEVTQNVSVGSFEPIITTAGIVQQPRACGTTNPALQGVARVTVAGGQTDNIEFVLVRDGDTLTRGLASLNEPFWSLLTPPDIITRDFSELGPGYYQFVTRIVGANCWKKDTFVLRDPGTPAIRTVNTTVATNQVCSNGTADIIIFGGGINIKYEILDAFGRNVFRPAQSSSKFALPSGTYVARVRTGLGRDINDQQIPFCYTTFGPFSVGCTFSRDEISAQTSVVSDLTVYPNPNRGNFNVNFTAQTDETMTLTVTDLTGRTLRSMQVPVLVGEQSVPVEVTGVTSGIYLLNCKTGSETKTVKLIIE